MQLIILVFVNRYWLTNNVHIKRPTTGLLMYTMATRFCEEIHLYGFWPFPLDPQGKAVKYHYYDTLKYEYTSSSSPHTMPLEFRTLSTLHRQGALRLHTGTCDADTWPQKELQSKSSMDELHHGNLLNGAHKQCSCYCTFMKLELTDFQ